MDHIIIYTNVLVRRFLCSKIPNQIRLGYITPYPRAIMKDWAELQISQIAPNRGCLTKIEQFFSQPC
jgi:hypothetical protein